MNDSTGTGLRFFYFDVTHAIREHDWIIERTGGMAGTKDIGQLWVNNKVVNFLNL